MKMESRRHGFELPFQFHLSEPKGDGVVVAFHGFQDNAASMLKRLGWLDAELPFQLLAVNAPFPVPVWTKEGMKETFSWYFRDRDRGISIVEPEQTAQRIAQLIQDLGLENTPKILFGFSQGGYLAPYAASRTKNVRALIGTGCGYNLDAYQKLDPRPILAIHGEKDERVEFERSKREFEAVKKLGFKGEFKSIVDLDHKVDKTFEPLVRAFALENLKGKNP